MEGILLIKYCKLISTGQLVFSVNAEQPDSQVMASALSMEGVVEADVEIGTMNFDDFRDARKIWDLEHLSTEEKRKPEYPPMQDYLDGIVKGDQSQIDKYIADCLAVKEKYPKGDN